MRKSIEGISLPANIQYHVLSSPGSHLALQAKHFAPSIAKEANSKTYILRKASTEISCFAVKKRDKSVKRGQDRTLITTMYNVVCIWNLKWKNVLNIPLKLLRNQNVCVRMMMPWKGWLVKPHFLLQAPLWN